MGGGVGDSGGDDVGDATAAAAEIAESLDRALGEALPAWLERRSREVLRAAGVGLDARHDAELTARCAELGAALHARVGPAIRADVDERVASPLDVIRRGLGPVNEMVSAHGVPPRPRDDFETRLHPDDVHGFAPASFADIDPSLQDLGVAWGAARAYVHLRRRAEDR